jgi:hypothetical protein
MALRLKNAIGILIIVLLSGIALVGIGCSDSGSESERAVAWRVDRPVGNNWVRLSAVVKTCDFDPPLLEEPVIEYNGNRVDIELRRTPEELEEDQSGCLLSLLTAFKKVTFKRSLDDLVLYDSSIEPPKRRWPPVVR